MDLVFPLRNRLPYLFHDYLKLLGWPNYSALNQLQFRDARGSEIIHDGFELVYILNGVTSLWMLSDEIKLAPDRTKDGSVMRGKSCAGSKQS